MSIRRKLGKTLVQLISKIIKAIMTSVSTDRVSPALPVHSAPKLWPVAISLLGVLAILALRVMYALDFNFNSRQFAFNWGYTHFLFNYDVEFVKRGLTGELLGAVFKPLNRDIVKVFCLVLAVGFVGALNHFFYSAWQHKTESRALGWLVLLAVVSPATSQHFMYDFARLDMLVYGCWLALLWYWRLQPCRSYCRDGLIVATFFALVLLIHEAAFFWIVPTTLLMWRVLDRTSPAMAMQIIVGLLALVVTYIISTYGAYTTLDHDQHLAVLREQYGPWVVRSAVRVLHDVGMMDNFLLTMLHTWHIEHLWQHGVFFVAMSPFALLFLRMILAIKPCLARSELLLVVVAWSPLVLYPLGLDHFRWWSLAICNAFVVLLFLCQVKQGVLTSLEAAFVKPGNKILAVTCLLLSVLIGPLQNEHCFNWAGVVVDYIVAP